MRVSSRFWVLIVGFIEVTLALEGVKSRWNGCQRIELGMFSVRNSHRVTTFSAENGLLPRMISVRGVYGRKGFVVQDKWPFQGFSV